MTSSDNGRPPGEPAWFDRVGGLVVSHGFFLAVVAVLLVIIAVDLAPVLGTRPAEVVQRNSEGVAMLLFPWYWLTFAGDHPLSAGRFAHPPPNGAGQVTWIVGWAGLAVLLQGISLELWSLPLPPGLITLGEAPVVIAVMSMYLGVTRQLLPGLWHDPTTGPPVPAGWIRLAVLVVLVAVVVATYTVGSDIVPSFIGDYVRLNVEAVAGVVLVGITTDAVLTSSLDGRRIVVWCIVLLAVPLAARTSVGAYLPFALQDWIRRGTEAFPAAAVIAVWFWAHDVRTRRSAAPATRSP